MCDLILYNANVITMDPFLPRAELIAVRDGRILAVADDSVQASLKGKGTQRIDCAGGTLLPGFIDAHCHLHAYAESLVSLDLSRRGNVRSIADIQRLIRGCSGTRAPGEWIRGKAYSEFDLAERRHPNRWDLDAAAPLNPVKLSHRSGHSHVLNSLALRHVGITAETGDPPGGFIDREPETGEPTGILHGMGGYLADKIPPLDGGELDRGVALANERILSCGITSVQDASSVNNRRRWKELERWKELGIFRPRVTMMAGVDERAALTRGFFMSRLDAMELRTGGVKIIADRITGSLHPSREELNAIVEDVHKEGLQAVIHAVEESVIEAACHAVARALEAHPRPDHRHRVEHCSVCPAELLQKMARLGIAVVTQPAFLYYSGDRYLKTVSRGELAHLYPIGSFLRAGLRVGFGSDFPIADPNPLVGVHAAVNRISEGGDILNPGERIGLRDALRMYTAGAAEVNFEEGIKGCISPGKLADFVLLSDDPFSVEADRLQDIRVEMTVLGGRIVWEKGTVTGVPFIGDTGDCPLFRFSE